MTWLRVNWPLVKYPFLGMAIGIGLIVLVLFYW